MVIKLYRVIKMNWIRYTPGRHFTALNSIEPLAELITTNPLIQGISDEGNDQHKLAIFADDMLLFLDDPISSVPALLHSLN